MNNNTKIITYFKLKFKQKKLFVKFNTSRIMNYTYKPSSNNKLAKKI